MRFFSRLFRKEPTSVQPEELYKTTITEKEIKVEHPKWGNTEILWDNIDTISLVNTDRGPWQPDIWLNMQGNSQKCLLPQGAILFELVYSIVSQYEGFDFENVIKSMSCTDNVEFPLWTNIDTDYSKVTVIDALKPKSDENEIIGEWVFKNNKALANVSCRRIEWLRNNYLIKINTTDNGWTTNYKDPLDERYWEHSYPRGEMQGGGPPMLKYVDQKM